MFCLRKYFFNHRYVLKVFSNKHSVDKSESKIFNLEKMKILWVILILFKLSLVTSESYINGTIGNEVYCTYDDRTICEEIQGYVVDNDNSLIDSEDFEMTAIDRNENVKGFYITKCTVGDFYSCNVENVIKFLPIKISDTFPNLLTIRAEYKSISKIRKENLKNLNKLRFLDLTGNKIETIEAGSFDDLVELISLGMSNNKIKNLHENLFKNLVKLEELYLQDNQISLFKPKQFENLKNLKFLDLSGNQLDSVHEDIFKDLGNLEKIKFVNCNLKSLPQRIFENLLELKSLDGEKNQLKTLPENLFINNQKLALIFLKHNKLQRLTYKTFENLPIIEFIALKDNECIDVDFGDWRLKGPMDNFHKDQLKKELKEKC
ncbi:hypothetical protein PVAND_000083 [Polypedilum vanderplanki]|uniref:Uncharacterized protein n=1 Tax=Polypedilum vanderplanki TaxID=319348 RepID=A0A9J6BK84_POLVA|nr:hypothetical protein PVAND_000083 [Polypedilum vanderplanki]